MPDYQNAKIYKLWAPQGDEIYIGSTTQSLAVRKAQHKRQLNSCSRILFQKYDDVRIELIEEFPCKNRMELVRREGEIMRNNDCINKRIAGRTDKEYYEDNKEQIREKQKEYMKTNAYKEKRREYMREYHQTDDYKEKLREYRETDAYKEKQREYMREYRKNNKKK